MTRLFHSVAILTIALSFVFGVVFSGAAMAAIIYQNNNTYVLNGSSDVSVGDYGYTGGTVTYVIDASTTFSPSASVNEMLFNTAGTVPGPDLYLVQNSPGCSSSLAALNIYWNEYDSCASPFSGAPPASLTDGNLHQYVIVVDPGTSSTSLYVDGSLEGTAVYHAPADNLSIGGDVNGIESFDWIGTISGVTIYNTALTADQVAALPEPAGPSPAPEPASIALLLSGLFGLRLIRRKG